MTFLKQIDGRWQGRGNASPRDFFQSAEPGFFLDFSTTAPLYQDNLAATPLTLPDQSVGLAADRSRTRSPITVAAAVQASLGLRPKWGRAPKGGRRNRMTDTAGSTGWAAAGTTPPTVTNGATFAGQSCMSVLFPAASPIGYAACRAARNILVSPWSAGVSYAQSIDLALSRPLVGAEALQVVFQSSVGAFGAYTINAANSAAFATGAFARAVVTGAGGGGTGSLWPVITPSGTLASDVTVYTKDIQIETAPATAYQVVGATGYDVTEAGLPSYGYIRPDLMDDYLTVTTPAAQTGDVMVFGRKGTWLETGVAYGSGAAVAIGPTTMTGLPAGLLAAVQGPVSDIAGGLVGVLAIGRSLTEAERAAAINYYKARGAAGLLAAGADEAVNGEFATDLTGWTIPLPARGAVTWDAGTAKVVNDGTGGSQFIQQQKTTVIGAQYLVEATVTAVAGATVPRMGIGSTSGGSDLSLASLGLGETGLIRAIFKATSSTSYIWLQPNGGTGAGVSANFDNVTIKPLTVTP